MAGRNRTRPTGAPLIGAPSAPGPSSNGEQVQPLPEVGGAEPSVPPEAVAPPEKPSAPAEDSWQKLVRLSRAKADDDELSKAAWDHLEFDVRSHSVVLERYNVLYLFSHGTLTASDADAIYSAAQGLETARPILLVIHSRGGLIAPAYFISKICRHYAGAEEFAVAVPRKAKSAATLICCGADTIHMGLMSELGPIDPQIEGMPALGLKNAIDHIADLVRKHPAATEMFASYLAKSLTPSKLGYYERVAESAAQYAERLMQARKVPAGRIAGDVAKKLVYEYKDHGFVIDGKEAEAVFPPGTISRNTPEYQFANAAYNALDFASTILRGFARKRMTFVGAGVGGFNFIQVPDDE